jgi:predicted nucleic acid-binding protein
MLWHERHFDIVCSDALLAELIAACKHPNVVSRISVDRLQALLHRLRRRAIWTPGTLDATGATPDAGDDILVSAALEAGATFIVTWDRKLVDQGNYQHVRFVTPDEFISTVVKK